jgi:FtsH-binding integral membrane protein
MVRIPVQRIGYRAVALIIWSTAAVAGASALVALQSTSDETMPIRPIIASLGLIVMGFAMFSRRGGSPSRDEVFTWLIVLLVAIVLLIIGLVYHATK